MNLFINKVYVVITYVLIITLFLSNLYFALFINIAFHDDVTSLSSIPVAYLAVSNLANLLFATFLINSCLALILIIVEIAGLEKVRNVLYYVGVVESIIVSFWSYSLCLKAIKTIDCASKVADMIWNEMTWVTLSCFLPIITNISLFALILIIHKTLVS